MKAIQILCQSLMCLSSFSNPPGLWRLICCHGEPPIQGMEAQSKHPGLRTPSSARLRPAFVVTSSFREHRRTEHPFLIYLLSPILEFSDVQNSTMCRTISFCAPAGAAYCSAGAPGQVPSPVPVSVGRLPSSAALVVAAIVSSCLRNFLASSINRFLSL